MTYRNPQLPDSLLLELETLFLQVDQKLSQIAGPPGPNPCIACKSCCCTAQGSTQHRVEEIEFAFMERHVGLESTEKFRRFIARERRADGDGTLVFNTCPNYDWDKRGCGVYAHRPFACRLYGNMKPAGTTAREGCGFDGYEQVFESVDYFRDVPGAGELRRLAREYSMFAPPRAAHFVAPEIALQAEADLSHLQVNDPFDRALLLQFAGRLGEALEVLIEVGKASGPSLYLDYRLAMLLTLAEQHAPALELYRSLIDRLPLRVDLHYYAGVHALFCNATREAKEHFLLTIQGVPDHSLALGFLGYMSMQESRLEEAETYFLRALSTDKQNPFLYLRLGVICQRTGRLELAREYLEEAALHKSTESQARQALQACGAVR